MASMHAVVNAGDRNVNFGALVPVSSSGEIRRVPRVGFSPANGGVTDTFERVPMGWLEEVRRTGGQVAFSRDNIEEITAHGFRRHEHIAVLVNPVNNQRRVVANQENLPKRSRSKLKRFCQKMARMGKAFVKGFSLGATAGLLPAGLLLLAPPGWALALPVELVFAFFGGIFYTCKEGYKITMERAEYIDRQVEEAVAVPRLTDHLQSSQVVRI